MNVIKKSILLSFLLFLKGYLIKEIENKVLVLVFPRNFSFLPNFHAYTENVFYFLFNIRKQV